jgi:hypothetical protein
VSKLLLLRLLLLCSLIGVSNDATDDTELIKSVLHHFGLGFESCTLRNRLLTAKPEMRERGRDWIILFHCQTSPGVDLIYRLDKIPRQIIDKILKERERER